RERKVPELDVAGPLDRRLAVKAMFLTLDGQHGVKNELACHLREQEHIIYLRKLVRLFIEEVVSETTCSKPANTFQGDLSIVRCIERFVDAQRRSNRVSAGTLAEFRPVNQLWGPALRPGDEPLLHLRSHQKMGENWNRRLVLSLSLIVFREIKHAGDAESHHNQHAVLDDVVDFSELARVTEVRARDNLIGGLDGYTRPESHPCVGSEQRTDLVRSSQCLVGV